MTDLSALAAGASSYTSEYAFVRGEYALGNERVPYYSVSMSVADSIGNLSLARDLIFDPSQPVRLEELFQRDLDKSRANTEIKRYLQQPDRVKFFNSFTVVLMPVERGDRPVPLDSYPDDDDFAPSVDEVAGLTLTQVGTVRLRSLESNPDVGFISWNRDRVRAVIIDGQHRFFALKQLHADEAFRAGLRPETTRLPVLLLVLDQRAGFKGPAGTPSNVLRTCRTIFIDLNKNAESVSATRQYLMDDRDLNAVSMRNLISDEIGGGSVAVNDRDRVPLALVDWYSDQAKFDRGLHATSVVVLYDIATSTLDRRTPVATDYDEWRAYIGELRDRVVSEPWQQPWDVLPVFERLDESAESGAPFGLVEDEVKAVADRFAESLGQLIVQPLVRLKPYRDLAQAYTDAGLLGGELELWLGHDDPGKAAFERLTGHTPERTATRIAGEQKAAYPLAFQVVFQKAIVSSAVLLDDARDALEHDWSLDEGAPRRNFAEVFCERFDARATPFLTGTQFWRGTGVDLNGNINFARPAANGIAGLIALVLLAPLSELMSADGTPSDVDQSVVGMLQRDNSDSPGPLATDTFQTDASLPVLVSSYRWMSEQLDTIRPGPAATAIQGVTRTSARSYRQQVRKYLDAEARALGFEVSDELRDIATAVHGAKRIAAAATQGTDHRP